AATMVARLVSMLCSNRLVISVRAAVCAMSLGIESVLYPVQRIVGINADHVEAYGMVGIAGVVRQKMPGRVHDPALLVAVHGGCGTAVIRMPAVAHFDDDQAVLMRVDEIQFAASGVVIAGDALPAAVAGNAIDTSFRLLPALPAIEHDHCAAAPWSPSRCRTGP